jgi:hypothetical protein
LGVPKIGRESTKFGLTTKRWPSLSCPNKRSSFDSGLRPADFPTGRPTRLSQVDHRLGFLSLPRPAIGDSGVFQRTSTAVTYADKASIVHNSDTGLPQVSINRVDCRLFRGSDFERKEEPKQPHPISLASSGTNSTSEVALVGLANETITTRQRQLAIKPTHHTRRVDATKATCSECNFPRNG